MVAEFVARQHSGSPINGETPLQNHSVSNMPTQHNSSSNAGGGSNLDGTTTNSLRLDSPSPIHQNMPPTSMSNSGLGINGNSNSSSNSSPSNGRDYLHDHGNLLMSQGSMSPQSPGSDIYNDGRGSGFDLTAQLKRKELFTQRKQREFIPENKKDDSYWDRRRRNNEAAKRSREKRRYNDMVLEQRVVELTKENHVLKAQLEAIKDKFNITAENLISVDQIMATLPTSEQVLSITKRAKLTNTVPPTIIYPDSPSPVPTSVIHQSIGGIDSPPSPIRLQHSQSSATAAIQLQQHQTPSSSQPTQQAQTQQQSQPQLSSKQQHHSPQQQQQQVSQTGHHHHHFRLCQSTSPSHTDYRDSDTYNHPHHHIGSGITVPPNTANNHHLHHHHHHHHSPHQHVQFATTANITSIPTAIVGGSSMNGNNVSSPSGVGNVAGIGGPPQLCATAAVALATNISNICYTTSGAANVFAAAQAGAQLPSELHQYDTALASTADNVLNLSRRGGGANSPYELSSGPASSGVASGDDEQCDNQPSAVDINNSLPLKLRHKSHLGDKDAATALLALHHIKQEPNVRASPPWDGEGSSDERDSGISIGTEWTSAVLGPGKIFPLPLSATSAVSNDKDEENIHLKSQIARLENEVATIKNMMILSTTAGQSATATAQ